MKKIAIIGGGPAGLVMAKEARAAGLEPVVMEKADTLGGLWRPDSGGMWQGMRTNISRDTCCFSDHPWDRTADDFPTATAVHRYLLSYAQAFDVATNARLNTSVLHVKPHTDKWRVTSQTQGQRAQTETFDYVTVASGIFQTPLMPRLSGLDDFNKPILHSADYKSPHRFHGQHVVVVGSAFSGNEIAADLAKAGIAVTQLCRTPAWIIPRRMPDTGLPIDYAFYTRRAPPAQPLSAAEKNSARNRFMAATFGNPGDSHPALWVDPESSHPTGVVVSDDYLDLVRQGKIKPHRTGLQSLTRGAVVLGSGERLAADAVICCTGYKLNLPFFELSSKLALQFDGNDQLMPVITHKETLHPALPGLAFVGLYRGPYFGIMELQARLAAAIFSGQVEPPSPRAMQAGLEEARAIRGANPRPQFPRGDYVGFADELAGMLGVEPKLEEHPNLRGYLTSGMVIPAQYRLSGMGAKPEIARAAIEAMQCRALHPVRDDKVVAPEQALQQAAL